MAATCTYKQGTQETLIFPALTCHLSLSLFLSLSPSLSLSHSLCLPTNKEIGGTVFCPRLAPNSATLATARWKRLHPMSCACSFAWERLHAVCSVLANLLARRLFPAKDIQCPHHVEPTSSCSCRHSRGDSTRA